jgi:hypothetical protein
MQCVISVFPPAQKLLNADLLALCLRDLWAFFRSIVEYHAPTQYDVLGVPLWLQEFCSITLAHFAGHAQRVSYGLHTQMSCQVKAAYPD